MANVKTLLETKVLKEYLKVAGHEHHTWPEFVEWLQLNYRDEDIHLKIRTLFENRKLRKDESFKDYLDDKIRLFELSGFPLMDEKYLSHAILEGLNENLRVDLAKQIGVYPSLETLKTRLKFLQQVETYNDLVDDNRAIRGIRNEVLPNYKFKPPIQNNKNGKKPQPRCFACNELGHYAPECKKKVLVAANKVDISLPKPLN